MKAIVSERHGPGSVVMKEMPEPGSPPPGHVLLKMKAVGVCGSDIHMYHGSESYPRKSPVILGHEMTGVVAEAGEGVVDFRKGQRVVSETAFSVCGKCYNCRRGNYNLCPGRMGFGALTDGGMAEYLIVRQGILHHVPDGVDDITAALTEPSCVAFNAVSTLGRIEPGDSVLIIGPGPIGLLSLQVALLRSPYEVSVLGTKRDSRRLETARSVGADRVFEDATEAAGALRTAGWGDGVDVVVDASGVSATMKTALDAVRPGGRIIKVGWGPDIPDFNLDGIVAKAVELRGSFSHNWETWERVMRLFRNGRLKSSRIARSYAFDDWESAFDDMSKLQIAKGVLMI